MATNTSSRLLRHAILLDAVVSGATGALLAAGAGPLSGLLGLPQALLTGAGLFCVVYAAALALLARRPVIPRGAALTVVAGNVAWVAASVWLPVSGLVAPTALGTAFVLFQATAVLAFAVLQRIGLSRMEARIAAV